MKVLLIGNNNSAIAKKLFVRLKEVNASTDFFSYSNYKKYFREKPEYLFLVIHKINPFWLMLFSLKIRPILTAANVKIIYVCIDKSNLFNLPRVNEKTIYTEELIYDNDLLVKKAFYKILYDMAQLHTISLVNKTYFLPLPLDVYINQLIKISFSMDGYGKKVLIVSKEYGINEISRMMKYLDPLLKIKKSNLLKDSRSRHCLFQASQGVKKTFYTLVRNWKGKKLHPIHKQTKIVAILLLIFVFPYLLVVITNILINFANSPWFRVSNNRQLFDRLNKIVVISNSVNHFIHTIPGVNIIYKPIYKNSLVLKAASDLLIVRNNIELSTLEILDDLLKGHTVGREKIYELNSDLNLYQKETGLAVGNLEITDGNNPLGHWFTSKNLKAIGYYGHLGRHVPRILGYEESTNILFVLAEKNLETRALILVKLKEGRVVDKKVLGSEDFSTTLNYSDKNIVKEVNQSLKEPGNRVLAILVGNKNSLNFIENNEFTYEDLLKTRGFLTNGQIKIFTQIEELDKTLEDLSWK